MSPEPATTFLSFVHQVTIALPCSVSAPQDSPGVLERTLAFKSLAAASVTTTAAPVPLSSVELLGAL